MKKSLILFLLSFLLVGMNNVNALDSSDDNYGPINQDYQEETKYFKIVTLLNDSAVLSLDGNTNSAFTTEITEAEFYSINDSVNGSSSTTTSTYKLTIKLESYGSNYKYTASTVWNVLPPTNERFYDTIAIGFYQSVKPKVSPSWSQYYCLSGGGCTTQRAGYREYQGVNGVAATYYLPSGNLTALKQTLTVIITKTDSNSTVIKQLAEGSYGHAHSSVTYTQAKAFRIDGSGLHYTDQGAANAYLVNSVGTTWKGTW